jgi:hypothetical protein
MKIVVFSPTKQYGGLDVNFASVTRQILYDEIIWVIADELMEEREFVWKELSRQVEKYHLLKDIHIFKLPMREGYPSNLTSSYNHALDLAADWKADLFVSLQDYMYISRRAVKRFVILNEQDPNALFAGLCSITDNPTVEEVVNPKGLYTIFKNPFFWKPQETFWWKEVRGANLDSNQIYEVASPQEWELNWCAIGRDLIPKVRFNPEYDRGIAYDHQAYAMDCMQNHGAKIYLDPGNHALGLPHKLYFPEVTEYNGTLTQANRELLMKEWGI